MIKKMLILLLILIPIALISLSFLPQSASSLGIFGNKQLIDFTNKFTYAVVYAPDGSVVAKGNVESWTDFEDGDQLQVKIDGVTYLTHSSLIILSTK